jgi:NAD(P)-dependent dehydrogenase (short-subunit alcohol dehydrogenase family)
MFSLQGKTAVVTGAGSGIGQAIAQVFARQGAMVAAVDINEGAVRQTVASIDAAGHRAQAFVCDVADAESVAALFRDVEAQLQTIDILVNNAGIAHVGNLQTTTEADFERIYRVNVKGVFLCAQAGVEVMLRHGGGVMLNMASIASHIGLPDRFAYGMSKGAVLTMTKSIAVDYVAKNIRCNCISPARVHTPFVDGFLAATYPGREQEMMAKLAAYQPIGRMGRPDEVAALALYLCSDEASFVTGQAYPIDGGVLAQ